MAMSNRQIVGGEPYRYAYQGQEKDPETGKAFLRLWDRMDGGYDDRPTVRFPYRDGNNPILLLIQMEECVDADGNPMTIRI